MSARLSPARRSRGVMTRGQSFGEPIALRRIAYPLSAIDILEREIEMQFQPRRRFTWIYRFEFQSGGA